jgi:hypothetical protein
VCLALPALNDVDVCALGSTCLHLHCVAGEAGLWEDRLRARGVTSAGLVVLCQHLADFGLEDGLEWELDESDDSTPASGILPQVTSAKTRLAPAAAAKLLYGRWVARDFIEVELLRRRSGCEPSYVHSNPPA